MTRKHFTTIAYLLRVQKNQFKSDRHHAEFCIQMGYALSQFNARFEMSTFLEACHHDSVHPVDAKDLI